MKRVLIVNHVNPFITGGAPYCSHAYLKAFAELFDGNIDTCFPVVGEHHIEKNIRVQNCFEIPDFNRIGRLQSLITGNIQIYTPFLTKHLRNNPNLYSLAILNGSYEGGALVDICHSYGLRVVTIHHNFDFEYAKDNTRNWKKPIFCHHVFNLQKKAYKNSDYNLFLTREDLALCTKAYGKTNARNEVIGVFEFDIIPPWVSKTNDAKMTFVITGSLCTMQGVDGIKYFFEELYQFIPADCNVIVSGRSPSQEVIELCGRHKNVKLIPNPRNMSEVISSGDVYICPTREGGGLKLRVMDGLKLGLPVITHNCSARGYDIFHNSPYFKSFSSKEEFKKAVYEIVELYKAKKIDKREIYDKYKAAFSFESGQDRLKKIFQQWDIYKNSNT